MARSASADGTFIYAVKTTGVYCRPTCSSKRPRRENVRFFDDADAAGRAGFRACRRCRPREATATQAQADVIARACRALDSVSPPALGELAAAAGFSAFHFQRVFKAATGVTPKAYATACRRQRLEDELRSAATVTDAMLQTGFGSTSGFYREANRTLGMTPSHRRRGAPAEVLQFAIGCCTLGHVLVASSERGVCCILLGDAPATVLGDFQNRFPKADVRGGDPEYERLVGQVIALIDDPSAECTLPLDIRGTAFQQRVWSALRDIPAGQTRTYSQLAESLGTPGSVRAVASACAANPLAVVVPCHRVVRIGGALAGYRWGIERKAALLAAEQPTEPAASKTLPAQDTG